MTAWAKMMMSAMNGFPDSRESGLVRMFRTEYGKEYQLMKKNGFVVNDKFVKTFLEDRKKS